MRLVHHVHYEQAIPAGYVAWCDSCEWETATLPTQAAMDRAGASHRLETMCAPDEGTPLELWAAQERAAWSTLTRWDSEGGALPDMTVVAVPADGVRYLVVCSVCGLERAECECEWVGAHAAGDDDGFPF